MADPVRYRGTMQLSGRNTGILVPPDVLEALGGGKRPAVRVVVNGYAYTSTVGSMGGRALIPFSSDRRTESGIAGGDEIEVELALDDAPRVTVVPDDLLAALRAAGAEGAFEGLAPSARKAHVTNVESAKSPETRQRRVGSIAAKLAPGG